ncbi:hypothetical protein [Planktothrix sp.]|uniref:hypothetical protein n=1 Tax=Planktothrix sp. TaxID=3088171 RepID=UPI0038D4AE86
MFALEFPFPDRDEQDLRVEDLSLPVVDVAALLKYYGFDLSEQTSEQIIDQWLKQYQADWVFLAILEALYQGRYKAISVQQILIYWQRRGQPIYHFTADFQRLICYRCPQDLLLNSNTSEPLLIHEIKESGSQQSIKTQASPELKPDQIDKISLKHPDFYRKLKGFMDDKNQEEKKN